MVGEVLLEVKRGCQHCLKDCLPLFKHNTTKTQTCNCGSAESDAVAIVWLDICNYGAGKKNTISKTYNKRQRGRKYENTIWNLCVKLSLPSSCLVTPREGRTSSSKRRTWVT